MDDPIEELLERVAHRYVAHGDEERAHHTQVGVAICWRVKAPAAAPVLSVTILEPSARRAPRVDRSAYLGVVTLGIFILRAAKLKSGRPVSQAAHAAISVDGKLK